MPASELDRVEQAWPDLAPMLVVPHTEGEYHQLVALLDSVIGTLIERYEDEHVPELSYAYAPDSAGTTHSA